MYPEISPEEEEYHYQKNKKKLYKASAKHWFWQILRWRIQGYTGIKQCAFCKECDMICAYCEIDHSLCDGGGTMGMINAIHNFNAIGFRKELFKASKKLRRELKKRSK